jgi:hypothetical protein
MKTRPLKTSLALVSLLVIAVSAAALVSACTNKIGRYDSPSTTRRGSY